MKYKVELNYVCCQATKPWWSKIEIQGSETRMTKKNQLEMDVIKRGSFLITNKINKEEKKVLKNIFGITTTVATSTTKPRTPLDQQHWFLLGNSVNF